MTQQATSRSRYHVIFVSHWDSLEGKPILQTQLQKVKRKCFPGCHVSFLCSITSNTCGKHSTMIHGKSRK